MVKVTSSASTSSYLPTSTSNITGSHYQYYNDTTAAHTYKFYGVSDDLRDH